jgi:hypothetical protein
MKTKEEIIDTLNAQFDNHSIHASFKLSGDTHLPKDYYLEGVKDALEIRKDDIDGLVEDIKGMKKTGVHKFENGYSNCVYCNEPRIIVDTKKNNIVVDEKSGGSSCEMTRTEYNQEGMPCLKNISTIYNLALSDIIAHLKILKEKV